MLEMIVSFLPLNSKNTSEISSPKVYKIARLLNRDFYRIINSRRQSLIYKDKLISERCFFDLVEKATGRFQDIRLAGKSRLVNSRCKLI